MKDMNKINLDSANLALRACDNAQHPDAESMYGDYGWHITTEAAGDVCIQACEYAWLDEDTEAVVAHLMEADPDLSRDEAEAIEDRARTVREEMEAIEAELEAAVEAHAAGNAGECIDRLKTAETLESEHGDDPATRDLSTQLLCDMDAGD